MAQINVVQTEELRDPRKLVSDLGHPNPEVRQNARAMLVDIGNPAVGPLAEALSDPRPQVRWEAAKALTDLPDPAAIPQLISRLRDEDSGIRWVAAEALIAIGAPVLRPLLQAIVDQRGSPEFREAVHHVLHDMQDNHNQHIIGPVLVALSGSAPAAATPVAALLALRRMSPPDAPVS